MKILVMIPAYNEAGNIENVIKDLRVNAPQCDFLVLNDCSTDDTLPVLRALQADYLDLPVNLGIGGNVQAGYRYALENDYDIAIQFDGDGQHDASYLEALIRPIAEGEANLVVGSRFLEKEGFQSSAMRRFGIGFLSSVIALLGKTDILDVTSGMRAADRSVIALFADDYAQDYPEPESTLLACLAGAKVREIPVKMRERSSGKSSIGFLKSGYYMLKVTLSLLLLKMSWGKGNLK